MPKPSERMIQKSVRLPAVLWRRVEGHARAMAAASGGALIFSENDAIRDVLARNLPPVEGENEDRSPASSPSKPGAKSSAAKSTKPSAKSAKRRA